MGNDRFIFPSCPTMKIGQGDQKQNKREKLNKGCLHNFR